MKPGLQPLGTVITGIEDSKSSPLRLIYISSDIHFPVLARKVEASRAFTLHAARFVSVQNQDLRRFILKGL
jgi:hypothetical protein